MFANLDTTVPIDECWPSKVNGLWMRVGPGHEQAQAKLEQIASDPVTSKANRVSVLLANGEFPQTRTITHTLWAMFGVLPKDKVQFPHRHESVALDFVIDCKPGCYTLIGTDLGDGEMIKNPHQLESGREFCHSSGLLALSPQ